MARGFSYAVALEAALKLKETCGVWAEGFSSADLRHGPTAAVTRATPALVFHAGGALEADVEQLEGELRARGAPLVSIGPGRVVPTAEPPCEELAPFTLVLRPSSSPSGWRGCAAGTPIVRAGSRRSPRPSRDNEG